ncbi:MAG TPA: hypothetical protein VL357_05835 [Rariglobus sp.]|jgi:hypothetical protein|nr:hypothetical protein [Rariglobus sp.]
MTLLTTQERNDLRTALLAELVNASAVAFPVEALVRRATRSRMVDFEISLADARHELGELHGAGFAKVIAHEVTKQPHYQATPEGVLAHQNSA